MMPLPMANKNTAQTADAQLLSQTRVATPCRADWAQMVGDDKSRYCGSCKKNVYNLSAMTGKEAAALIREKEGNLCIRYYQRADGTVMTQDCPVGVAAVRRRMVRAFSAVVVSVASGLTLAFEAIRFGGDKPSLFAERVQVWAGRISPSPSPVPPEITITAGGMEPIPMETPAPDATIGESGIMGEMVMPEVETTMGKPRQIEPREVMMGRPAPTGDR